MSGSKVHQPERESSRRVMAGRSSRAWHIKAVYMPKKGFEVFEVGELTE
jgi:hypothetical protein